MTQTVQPTTAAIQPDPRDAELAQLRAEVETLRAQVAADATGLLYTRADSDEADDPTPVSRGLHVVAVTDGGRLVHETPDEPQCTPECDAMTGHPKVTGMARGWHHDDCPVVPVLEAADTWRLCAHRADYASAAEHERECPEHAAALTS